MLPAANVHSFRTLRRARIAINAALSLLLSLLVGIGGSAPAQASSNTGEFLFGTSKVLVEDIALCTKYKYPFDPNNNGGFTWNQTGYETCPSETLSASSLPATLHIKFRIQSIVPEEFLASNADAYITDAKGVRVSTARWAPSPLVDLDGPFNTRDGRYYAAFSISDPKLFPPGTYSLNIQFWNAQWIKLNGPSLQETPKSFTPFSFTISGSTTTSTTTSGDPSSCVIDPIFENLVIQSKQTLIAIYAKTNAISDFSAPGLMQVLEDYMAMVKTEERNVLNNANKFSSLYKGSGKDNCTGYLNFWDTTTSVQTQIASTQSLLDGYYAKAKAVSGFTGASEDSVKNCEMQGNIALTSIKKSLTVFAVYESKVKGEFDFTSPSSAEMFAGWLENLNNEYKNIDTWGMKLREYAKADPKCSAYETGIVWVTESAVRYRALAATITSLQAKAQKSQVTSPGVKEDSFADEDGVEEEPQGSLAVSYSTSLGRFIIKVESNLPDETLTIRATKKGARALRFTINTDEDGVGGVRTKTKLSGYTLILSYSGAKLDQLRVK